MEARARPLVPGADGDEAAEAEPAAPHCDGVVFSDVAGQALITSTAGTYAPQRFVSQAV